MIYYYYTNNNYDAYVYVCVCVYPRFYQNVVQESVQLGATPFHHHHHHCKMDYQTLVLR